jgi:hypothetical protein
MDTSRQLVLNSLGYDNDYLTRLLYRTLYGSSIPIPPVLEKHPIAQQLNEQIQVAKEDVLAGNESAQVSQLIIAAILKEKLKDRLQLEDQSQNCSKYKWLTYALGAATVVLPLVTNLLQLWASRGCNSALFSSGG